jgi:hypothetical protein
VTSLLASVDNEELLGRSGTGENDLRLGDPFLEEGSLSFIFIVKVLFVKSFLGKSITVNNNTSGVTHSVSGRDTTLHHLSVFLSRMLNDVDLVGNSGSSWRLITSNHDDLDTSGTALVDREIDLWSWWIVQGNNTDESEVVHGEGTSLAGVVRESTGEGLTPSFPVLEIELVVRFREFTGIKVALGESEDTLTELTEISVVLVDLGTELFCEINFLSVDEDLAASGENSLWCTLHVNSEGSIVSLHITDEQVELDVRRERNDAFSLLSGTGNGEFVDGILRAASIERHERLSELNETSLGGITLTESLDVRKGFLSNSETSLHFGGFSSSQATNVADSHTLDTSVELGGIIIRWFVSEESGGTENESLKEFNEPFFFRIITGNDLLIGLVTGLVGLMSLPVDGSIDLLSVVEHVGDSHTVLSESTGLI